MNVAFYVAAVVAILATALAVSRRNAVHALLYLVVSFLSIALVFLLLGAPFVAAAEVIIYAGAIMVLFVFVVMMLSMRPKGTERVRVSRTVWIGPSALSAILLAELIYVTPSPGGSPGYVASVGPHEVARALLGPYLLGVELSSMLLLSALVGAYHLAHHLAGRPREKGGAA